ncbi:hypothetical protein [Nocardioides rubriscoriae]|uniref:hypothetical protein n=1 Tax=Nocardioides rubriscoriae TaxID=642762 RepID=UPI00147980AA|nr:hypothetical protein [Nocardioides rubriscoriae]
MTKKLSTIAKAPSVADITSSTTRVGKVDFGTSLSGRFREDGRDRGPREVDPTPPRAVPDAVAPPAPTAAAPTAAPAAAPAAAEPPAPTPPTPDRVPALPTVEALDEETLKAAQSTGEMLEVLMELMVKDTGEHPTVVPAVDAIGEAGEVDGVAAQPSAALFDDSVSRSVAEVAASVIAAMRRVNEAHERHVVALELETARRCELLTSQADLDAELIRLHARREAHALVFAARARTGQAGPDLQQQGDELHEIGETLSRFAEAVETADAFDLDDTPDLPHRDIPRRV